MTPAYAPVPRAVRLTLILVLGATLAGCTAPRIEDGRNDAPGASRCPWTAEFTYPGLYDEAEDIANATNATFRTEQWAGDLALPFENATLRERWDAYVLTRVERTYVPSGPNGDDPYPTLAELYGRAGDEVDLAVFAPVDTPNSTIERVFRDFLANISTAPPGSHDDLVNELLASRHVSAEREGTPGNMPPGGSPNGTFTEYIPGEAYGEGFSANATIPLRLEALVSQIASIHLWQRSDMEPGRIMLIHSGWLLHFELARHTITRELDDGTVDLTVLPEGEAFLWLVPDEGVTWNDSDAREKALQALPAGGPRDLTLTQAPCKEEGGHW